ncbi:uncharacterized protein LOC124545575 [Schistocerca americana]|uniref:uncharacterized protein LOC124545575 n=1 Tax=Schistocerca americana TaxID=7009 RepID=UPI001F50393A|nr:uncharacterized protein LOC124545575 [Schistocerca americana]XP_049942843.1 uncharacterized protein LOC126419703 [Schistocerca serialis cubense]
MPLFEIVATNNAQNRTIWNVKSIAACDTTVEEPRAKKKQAQCYRCLQPGHVARYCDRPQKCVRCAGDHRSDECPVPREEPAKCCNCGEALPASYGGCRTLLDAWARQEATHKKPGTSYVDMAKSRRRQPRNTPSTSEAVHQPSRNPEAVPRNQAESTQAPRPLYRRRLQKRPRMEDQQIQDLDHRKQQETTAGAEAQQNANTTTTREDAAPQAPTAADIASSWQS